MQLLFFQFPNLIKSWHLMSEVFEVRVMRDCWHRYKVTICKFPGSGWGPGGTIWGVTPGPHLVLPTLMPGSHCLLAGYKRIRETNARLKCLWIARREDCRVIGICERLSLYLRRQNADINSACLLWYAMCSVCLRVVRIILVSSILRSVMRPHTRHTFKHTSNKFIV